MNADSLRGRIDDFEGTFRALAEAGLFPKEGGRAPQIVETIRAARTELDANHLPQAAEQLAHSEILLHRQIYSRSPMWRGVHIHQIPTLLYYLSLFCTIVMWLSFEPRLASTFVWGVPASALALGALGAILRGLYWMQRQVARRIFRTTFQLFHYSAPWIGALLGFGSFLLIKAGLLVFGGGSGTPSGGGQLADSAAAFVAGFNWTWFTEKLSGTLSAPRQPGSAK